MTAHADYDRQRSSVQPSGTYLEEQGRYLDEQNRPDPPIVGDEVAILLGFLERQRATFAWKCGGLNADGLRTTFGKSAMTLGGMLKHLARFEGDTSSEWLFGQGQIPRGTLSTGSVTMTGTGGQPRMNVRSSFTLDGRRPWFARARCLHGRWLNMAWSDCPEAYPMSGRTYPAFDISCST